METEDKISFVLGMLVGTALLLFMLLGAMLVSAVPTDNVYFRLNNTFLESGYAPICGNSLTQFSKVYHSGCTAYEGWTCNETMFEMPNYDFTLINANYNALTNFSAPSWSYGNASCYYYGKSRLDGAERILIAWKVRASGSGFCEIQHKWDFYVMERGGNISNTTAQLGDPFFELVGSCEIPVAPGSTTENTVLLTIDFTQKITLLLLIIFFIIILLLIFYHFFVFAGMLVLIFGFIFLVSNVGLIWAVLTIIVGVILAFWGGKNGK
jgi:hypothetical protein